MKDKSYKSTRGVGDGDLTAGLLGMMQGGGGLGDRMKSRKAAGGKCRTKSKSKYKSCNNNTPLQKFGKALKVIGTGVIAGGAGYIGAKGYQALKNR